MTGRDWLLLAAQHRHRRRRCSSVTSCSCRDGAGRADEPLYRLRGVRYSYPGKHLALDGIDLDIERGEQVCLLGANGSGKSTLLKLLDGIIGPSEGEMQALGP